MIISNHHYFIAILLASASVVSSLKHGDDKSEHVNIPLIRGSGRNLKAKKAPKSNYGKAPKGGKSQKSAKSSKANKSSKGSKSQGSLLADIDEASAARDAIRTLYHYDEGVADMCELASDQHQHCVYQVFKAGETGFECECKPTDGAQIFGEVDSNDDLYITWEELKAYFDSQACEFPFKYRKDDGSVGEYSSCTTVDDDFGKEWCSINVLSDGFHATGFFKYCDDADNLVVWNDALARLDEDGDGKLAFDEAITSARENRRRGRQLILAGVEEDCDDCNRPEYCSNPAIMAIDNHCRNFIKTVPLEDEEILQILATTMVDIYCDDVDKPELAYNACPMDRGRMNEWLERGPIVLYDKEQGFSVTSTLICLATAASDTVAALVTLYNIGMWIGGGSGIDCSELFDPENFDGKNALQYAIYTIKKGPHKDKRILSFQGTDFDNLEQVLADIWSVPMAGQLMINMRNEAVEVAKDLKPDFITGHSLGGILAELVCSETGIPGASFAALGAFDPFSLEDRTNYEKKYGNMDSYGTEIRDAFNAEQSNMLATEGYDVDEIREIIEGRYWEDSRHRFIREEYNGLVTNNLHNGVQFEVVMNTYDMAAQPLSSIDGAACSHIASSCDVRWTWFGAWPSTSFGHSSEFYAYKATSEFTIGWDEWDEVKRNDALVFLPGVQKNLACDYCETNAFCESGRCDTSDDVCYGTSTGKMPTHCPKNSVAGRETRGPCDNASECVSGRCEWHSFNPFSEYRCYDQIDNGGWCNEDSDCKSNNCNWWWYCS